MAPIHDTDIAEERWSKAEWLNFELWEKIEIRVKRRRRQIILSVFILFMFFMAVPSIMDRMTKWKGLQIARQITTLISSTKIRANRENTALRISFGLNPGISYRIDKVENCIAPADTANRQPLEEGAFDTDKTSSWFGSILGGVVSIAEKWGILKHTDFRLADPNFGKLMGVDNLVTDFCYDHLVGASYFQRETNSVGMLLLPTIDFGNQNSVTTLGNLADGSGNVILEENIRQDRVAMIVLEGTNADVTFE